jgi:hypothetical protein
MAAGAAGDLRRQRLALLAWAAAQPALAVGRLHAWRRPALGSGTTTAPAGTNLHGRCRQRQHRPADLCVHGDAVASEHAAAVAGFDPVVGVRGGCQPDPVDAHVAWPALVHCAPRTSVSVAGALWGNARMGGAAWYLAWNLLVAAPLTWLAWSHPRMGLVADYHRLYATAAAVWLVVKRRLPLRRNLSKDRHVAT